MGREWWLYPSGVARDRIIHGYERRVRAVVVIDPATIPHLPHFADDPAAAVRILADDVADADASFDSIDLDASAAVLKWLAEQMPKPPKPQEPTDPTARVTDRRENVWRLLADGDWVCTSGPDHGEYLVWEKLAAERGPLSIEGVTP